jgi:hypothetical protein
VLSLISEGCSNKQGALRMNISPRTFESHRAEAMRKLGARNTADLVRKALLQPPDFPNDAAQMAHACAMRRVRRSMPDCQRRGCVEKRANRMDRVRFHRTASAGSRVVRSAEVFREGSRARRRPRGAPAWLFRDDRDHPGAGVLDLISTIDRTWPVTADRRTRLRSAIELGDTETPHFLLIASF